MDAAVGAITALGLPPFYLVPITLFGIGRLFYRLMNAEGAGSGAAIGFCFGYGYFLGGCWWIVHSMFFNQGEFLWLLVPTLVIAPAALALFTAAAGGIFAAIKKYGQSLHWLAFASLWTFGEWLRGAVFPHFPWNPLGSVWAFDEVFIQAAAVVGVWGLSLLTAAAAALAAMAWAARENKTTTKTTNKATAKSARTAAIAATASLLALPTFGIANLALNPTELTATKLYIIQPSIPQEQRWKTRFANLQLRLNLSGQTLGKSPPNDETADGGLAATADRRALLLWAETASPFPLEAGEPATEAIAALLPPNTMAVAGYIHRQNGEYHNSLAFIDTDGEIEARYDKAALVPFGEYLPSRRFWKLLLGLEVTIGGTDFSPGSGPRVIAPNGVPPLIPLICFESIFPHFAAFKTADHRPQWLFNATNDGWFGNSPGPYQHFAAARLRAVESGLPLVRAAAGGISAIIDAHGRVIKRLPLGQRGAIIGNLPAAKPSLFNRFGAFITLFLVLLWTLMAMLWLIIFSASKRTAAHGH